MTTSIEVQRQHPTSRLEIGFIPALMTLLSALFLLRVVGQLLVTYADASWLPQKEHWQSGLLPYPALLASQIVILAVMAGIDRDAWRARGWFVAPRPRFAQVLRRLSVVYFAAMIVRYIVTMTLHPDWFPFEHSIPTFFHCILATYLYLYSGLVSNGDEPRPHSGIGGTTMDATSTSAAPFFRRVIQSCRRHKGWKVTDTTGAELGGKALLARAMVLRRLLRHGILDAEERHVGVLLPPSAAAVAVNLALTLDRRVPVNLNYTLSPELLDACIAQAGIRHVLTSRRVLERLGIAPTAELVILEDLREAPTKRDKAIGALQAYVLPVGQLLRLLGLHRVSGDDVMSIVFTSGSTSEPKGAMLTYANVASNVAAVDQVIHLRPSDVLVGVLPFFHSFGSTVTLWTLLASDISAAYHVNPLEAQAVGRLCRERRGTILLATPMFLRTYARRCPSEDMATLEVVVGGGERLPADVSDAFEAKFGVRPVEGYGATETSPLIAANVPPSRALGNPQTSAREGTVGRPVPGVTVKTVDRETGADLGPDQEGMLWVFGPNVMKGYLNRPDATAKVLRDGWYVTGDIATIDVDGFIRIVGRESRFAKIGGEMVPHIAVEEALTRLVGADDEGFQRVVVTSVPDDSTGERLVVVHTPLQQAPAELCRALAEAGLPRLFIPSPRDFVPVDHLPTVGTGKLDLKRLAQIAQEARGRPQ